MQVDEWSRILGETLVDNSDALAEHATADVVSTVHDAASSAIMVLCSAKWCPPCRMFTPDLIEYLDKLDANRYKVILLSGDHDENEWKEHVQSLPRNGNWYSIPFSNQSQRQATAMHFKIKSLPTLVSVRLDGSVITRDARACVSSDPNAEQFPWLDQQDPHFFLDDLEHTEPMPGPVWRDRFFMGMFLDPYLQSVEPEGKHLQRAGDIAGLTRVLEYALEQTTIEMKLSDTESHALQTVIGFMKTCTEIAKKAMQVKKASDFTEFLVDVLGRIRQLEPQGTLLLPGGFKGIESAHCIMYTIEKNTDGSFHFYVHNPGKGIKYHPSKPCAKGSKMLYQTTIKIESIPASKIIDSSFWYMMYKILVSESDDHRVEVLYDILLPWLSGRALAESLSDMPYHTPQRAEVGFVKTIMESTRHHLSIRGVSGRRMQYIFTMLRMQLLQMAVTDLNQVRSLYTSDERLLRHAAEQLSRSVLKLSKEEGLSPEFLICVYDLGEQVKNLASDRVDGSQNLPQLNIELTVPLEPFCNLELLNRHESVEHYAGWQGDARMVATLDLNSVSKAVSSFDDAVAAIKSCADMCLLLLDVRASTSSASFFCCSLIKHLVCSTLPVPLPVSTLDDEFEGCFWSTADLSYERQCDVLQQLLGIGQVYLTCAKSLDPTNEFQTVQTIVMAAILAISDAIIRVHANDLPSPVSVVLNGTEHLFGDGKTPIRDVARNPIFFLSLKSGGGVDFAELTAELPVLDPSLAHCRGLLLEYFSEQERLARKSLFSFQTRMNTSTYLGKEGPTLEFIKALCLVCGFDLNPDDEEGGMDDQVSFIEAATFYLISPESPFSKDKPELSYYRDLTMLYKIAASDTTHRRSPKLRRWIKADAEIRWRVKEVNRAKTMIDIDVAAFRMPAVCIDRKQIESPANVRSFLSNLDRDQVPTEDDVLHCTDLPTFDDTVSQEDAELLLSYLCAPYIQIPLVVSFFSSKDRIPMLINEEIRSILEAVLFEPKTFQSGHRVPKIAAIPCEGAIGSAYGSLLNELLFSPQSTLSNLLTLAGFTLELNTGSYESASSEIIMFACRLLSRVETYLEYAIENFDVLLMKNMEHSSSTLDLDALLDFRTKFRTLLMSQYLPLLQQWEAQAQEDANLDAACFLHAHMAHIYSGMSFDALDSTTVGALLSHVAFLETWYSAGVGASSQSFDEDEFERDNMNIFGASMMLHEKRRKREEKKREEEQEERPTNPLKYNDFETFDLLQRHRSSILKWLQSASEPERDNVFQQVLSVVTRTPNLQYFNWVLSNGLYTNNNGDIEIDPQTAQVFFRSAHIKPVPHYMAREADFGELFGSDPQHCALVAQHDQREWVRLVGPSYNLFYWKQPQEEIHFVNQPSQLRQYTPPITKWKCFVCGDEYALDAEGCEECQRRRPGFGLEYGGKSYGRVYVFTALEKQERWVLDIFEHALLNAYSGRGKIPFDIFLPSEPLSDDASICRLLAEDNGTFREYIVYKELNFCEAFVLREHGRRLYRSLSYTSNQRLSLAYLVPDIDNKYEPLPDSIKFSAGNMKKHVSLRPSLVMTRERNGRQESFLPGRLLKGLIPGAFLDHFHFWQQDKSDNVVGYPKKDAGQQWQYKIHVDLSKDPCNVLISRAHLDESELHMENTNSSHSLLNVHKQLGEEDPLIKAMNQSKVAMLCDQGYPEFLAVEVLKSVNYDLPMSQAWLENPENESQVNAILQSQGEGSESNLSCLDAPALARSISDRSRQAILLNLRSCSIESPLWRLCECLTRIEDASHILVWTNSDVDLFSDASLSMIELPRLKLKLRPKRGSDGRIRLHHVDHAGLFVSDTRSEYIDRLAAGIPHSILMENTSKELFVLVPSHPLHRPFFSRCPFSTQLVFDRGDGEWLDAMDSRYFLYPIHVSETFLTTPTQGAALYLILLRMLHREYDEAFRVADSCEADMELSKSESWLYGMLERAQNDFHPNEHACRLKLSLVMLHCKQTSPWFLQDEYRAYLAKLPLVSAACRLSKYDEMYLLNYIQSGGEFETMSDDRNNAIEIELGNRLAWLKSAEKEEPTAIMQRQVQKGCTDKWALVDDASIKFYDKFDDDSKVWNGNLSYVRPKSEHLVSTGSIETLNKLWKDSITGMARNLGFAFLVELFTSEINISVVDSTQTNNNTVAELFSRLLFLKNTGWGASPNLDIHRSYGERSMVPYILLRCLEKRRMWNSIELQMPTLQYGSIQVELRQSCSTASTENTPVSRFIDTLMVQCQLIAMDPRYSSMPIAIDAEDLLEVSIDHDKITPTLPQVQDLDCSETSLGPFSLVHGTIQMTPSDLSELCYQPLQSIGPERYVVLGLNNASNIDEAMPFDVSCHRDAQSHVAKKLLARLENDLNTFKESERSKEVASLKGIGIADLERIKRGECMPEEAVLLLGEIEHKLNAIREVDAEQLPRIINFVTETCNAVAMTDIPLTKAQYLLKRSCGLESCLNIDMITASCLSSNTADEIHRLNPYGDASNVQKLIFALCLRANRIGHIDRCLALLDDCRTELLRGTNLHVKQTGFRCSDLAHLLITKRFTFGKDAGFSSESTFDPRMVVFEYLANIILRQRQVTLVNTYRSARDEHRSLVEQMIMGAGKTTVIAPLLSLICANGSDLVTVVVPPALLEFSRSILRSRFTRVLCKRIHTFSFDRAVKRVRTIDRLYDKLEMARVTRGVVVTTPDAIKSLMLKYLELLHQMESAPAELNENITKTLRVRSSMSDALALILHKWKTQGLLIMDEVDLLLHPLKSELNFPIGRKSPLDLSPTRWELAIHLLDPILRMNLVQSSESASNPLVNDIQNVVRRGLQQRSLQSHPHLVLLDVPWYHAELKLPLSRWLLSWLRSKRFIDPSIQDEIAQEFLLHGKHRQQMHQSHSEVQQQVLTLSCDWLESFAPHMLSKINRVSYGLLAPSDIIGEMPLSRKLMAVPFVGKDVPSTASEFAHPDVLIGLTVCAYRYEGVRQSDMLSVVTQLQRDMRDEVGPFSLRPSCHLFGEWLSKGSSNATIMPLYLFQSADKAQMKRLHAALSTLPNLIHYYLERTVFPTCMQHQVEKLSASGQELGGSLLFNNRFGFSGTPSDLLPIELGECGYEQGSEGRICSVLTNPSIVKHCLKESWSPKQLLLDVSRDTSLHALIDTGALVTGMTNEEVARFILEHGVMEGVVFLDKQDRQMVLLRESNKIVPLSQCGLPKEKRFTFYDQVHTTGMDIKQGLDSCALVTLGKDMTWRDYAQGSYRMRGIGKGQTLMIYIIPEVHRLIKEEIKPNGKMGVIQSVAAWLLTNSMRSEKLQFMQLCLQNQANVWRKRAFDVTLRMQDLLLDSQQRHLRFRRCEGSARLAEAVRLFREKIDFTVKSDVSQPFSFQDMLKKAASEFTSFYAEDANDCALIDRIIASVGGQSFDSGELQSKQLNAEMVQEAEQEAEKQKEKQVEQEQQVRVKFSREDEAQVPWPIHHLSQMVYPADHATVHAPHPFYPFSEFSLTGTKGGRSPFHLPLQILLSQNYFRPQWATMGQRRLKNIPVLLEWVPQTDAHAAPDPVSSTTAQQSTLKRAYKLISGVGEKDNKKLLSEALRDFCFGEASISSFSSFLDGFDARYTEQPKQKRYFIAVSLSEASSLRRAIHQGHPIFNRDDIPVHIGLRFLNGNLLDATSSFRDHTGPSSIRDMAVQTLRFLNCEFFYKDKDMSLLLHAFASNSVHLRRAVFENLLLCRRRDRNKWHDTPLARLFHLPDEQQFLLLKATVARLHYALQSRLLPPQDAFFMFDTVGDGVLTETELHFALTKHLRFGVSRVDTRYLLRFADKNNDGVLNLAEFLELFYGPEHVLRPEDMLVTKTVQRLCLTPEFEEAYRVEAEERTERHAREAEERRRLEVEREEESRLAEKADREKQRAWEALQEEKRMQELLAPQQWQCPLCTFFNEGNSRNCQACDTPKPTEETKEELDEDTLEPPFWECAACTMFNPRERTTCEMCMALKPENAREEKVLDIWECGECTKLNAAHRHHCSVCATAHE